MRFYLHNIINVQKLWTSYKYVQQKFLTSNQNHPSEKKLINKINKQINNILF